jgi:hypothetical protein
LAKISLHSKIILYFIAYLAVSHAYDLLTVGSNFSTIYIYIYIAVFEPMQASPLLEN